MGKSKVLGLGDVLEASYTSTNVQEYVSFLLWFISTLRGCLVVVLNDCYVNVLRDCLDCFWKVYGRFIAYLWPVLWADL